MSRTWAIRPLQYSMRGVLADSLAVPMLPQLQASAGPVLGPSGLIAVARFFRARGSPRRRRPPAERPSWILTRVHSAEGASMQMIRLFGLSVFVASILFQGPVAAQTWTPTPNLFGPIPVQGTNSLEVEVAGDATGGVTAVWADFIGQRFVTRASRFTGGTWSAPVILSAEGDRVVNPQLATDRSGVATAAWLGGSDLRKTVQASRFSGGRWSPPVALSTSNNAYQVQLIADGTGIVTAVWSLLDGPSNTVLVQSSSFSNGAWSPSINVPAVSGDVGRTRLAVDGSGVVTAVWTSSDRMGQADTVVYAARLSRGVWSAPVKVFAFGRDGVYRGEVRIAADVAGAVSVIYSVLGGDGLTYLKASRFSNGSWSAPVDIHPPLPQAPHRADLVADTTGVVTVVWPQRQGADHAIMASRFSAGVWSPPAAVHTATDAQNVYGVDLAVDAAGVVTAVWAQEQVIMTSRSVRGVWAAPVEISAAVGNSRPQLTLDASGVVTAVWEKWLDDPLHWMLLSLEASRYRPQP